METKNIRVIRDITAFVNGETHELKAGWQKVKQEVADHWFVKANTDNGSSDAVPDTRDAQIVELSGQLGQLKEQLASAQKSIADATANEAQLFETAGALEAMTQARDNLLTENRDLTAQVVDLTAARDAAVADTATLNSKVADLQATIDLSAAPTETNTAAAAGKAKK